MHFPHNLECFVPHNEVAEYFENYAKMIDPLVATGVEVQNIVKIKNKKGFTVKTNNNVLRNIGHTKTLSEL